ncbi:UDP-glucose dehydrogenase family protein [Methanoplanus endosymbiosus]|uniref:UDP-glucose 6-dehydrogenase n=1 Tax=Methanoplanus endosymbiosus TaxID=33865 RepID=A0A9E7PP79_9EURY|nr:UDP-glucose/GDP-mannose dehydrogenase family protein [Methanoplanus endosymbiosus]UUX93550.1 UDP-glucose/GDP-mannose dehydrogenase family protein [Methanoplanus endosymbiosus]
MKISIIGSGYVGVVTGACLSEFGHEIVFVDIDLRKIDLLNKGIPPIYELGLAEILKKNKQLISATDDYNSAIEGTDLTFISVGTPCAENGTIDTVYVRSAAENIGSALNNTNKKTVHTVVVKSTVFPGTTESVVLDALERTSGKTAGEGFYLGCNPEFLKEGVAIEDFMNPDRIVIGSYDEGAGEVLGELYANFDCPKVVTGIKTAEMIKYTSNAFLATKISFANEIGNICKMAGIDTEEVFKGVGLDARINPSFFRSGIGFGGSCFPKDVRALLSGAMDSGVDTTILKAVLDVNEAQPLKMIDLLTKHMPDLRGRKIGLFGLAFKPDTDDIRESRAIPVISALTAMGAEVVGYDPLASENMSVLFPGIIYAKDCGEVMACDAVLITTEWPEFEDLDYSGKLVIDGRRIRKAADTAEIYEGVCW